MINNITPQLVMTLVRSIPRLALYITPETKAALKQSASFDGIRATYWLEIYDSVYNYLTGDKGIASFKSQAKTAIAQAFGDTVDLAYQDAGSELPLDEETLAWLNEQVQQEFGFVDDLFDYLRANWQDLDPEAEALRRAEGYARTLDSIYAEGKMRGSNNITLEFGGEDGAESCDTCQGLKGKRHRVNYILANGLIPRPGNTEFDCAGYRCEHFWFNPKTGERFDG